MLLASDERYSEYTWLKGISIRVDFDETIAELRLPVVVFRANVLIVDRDKHIDFDLVLLCDVIILVDLFRLDLDRVQLSTLEVEHSWRPIALVETNVLTDGELVRAVYVA